MSALSGEKPYVGWIEWKTRRPGTSEASGGRANNDNEGIRQPYAPGGTEGAGEMDGETIGSIGFIDYSAGHKGIVNCRP